MILAGMDEAGYGPRLGPLVVASNAFRVLLEGRSTADAWPVVRLGECGGLGVCDSKRAYSRAAGVGAIERAVLAFAALSGGPPADIEELLGRFAVEGGAEALALPWYGGGGLSLPREAAAGEVGAASDGAAEVLAASGLRYLGAAMSVVDAVRYNEIIERVGSKATLLFGRASILMRDLWEKYGREGIWLTVDRHGGRKFYAGLLDIAFPEAGIKIIRETEDESAYRLYDEVREMFVRFKVGGEGADSATALSSMWAKYVRELFMEMFNGYWLGRGGSMRATAGYWVDGERFIGDLVAARIVSESEAAEFTRSR